MDVRMPALNLRITGRLIIGFATLTALLAAAVGYTSFTLSGVNQSVERMVNLRTPVAIESTQMVGSLFFHACDVAQLSAHRQQRGSARPGRNVDRVECGHFGIRQESRRTDRSGGAAQMGGREEIIW
jgi:hypothetical protein